MREIQRIQIGRHVTDIMRLPCVFSCHKEEGGRLCYLLYDWDEQGRYIEAREGEWLVQTEDGRWHVDRQETNC